MAKLKSEGECSLCKTRFNKSSMTKHLQSCLGKTAVNENVKIKGSAKEKFFHIVVEGESVYWLHLRVSTNVTLADLDEFLRDIWLECCGHLSQFTINKTNYASSGEEAFEDDDEDEDLAEDMMDDFFGAMSEKGMAVKLDQVLLPGMKFSYEYDFGSTTDLNLKVISEGEAIISKKDKIKILARNDTPKIECMGCKAAPATQVCSQCVYDEDGWLCDECASKHECGEEMFLPVLNSPRVGVCGYEG